MSANSRIASSLLKAYPDVISRGAERLPLQEGDLVVDKGYVGMPRVPDDSIGRIRSIRAGRACVDWRDGSADEVPLKALARTKAKYEATLHDSAFELPKFKPGTSVALGNGDTGRVVAEVVGPTGFKSYRVEITGSVNPLTVGRRVYSTNNAMIKLSSLAPDAVAAIYRDGQTQPIAVVGCELAVDQDAQVVGLQKYSSMPTDHGMLFPYDPPQNVTFHMGNVRFPIDVIFVNRIGRIEHICENREPGVEEYWTHRQAAAVLEVNGGWCRAHGVATGDRLRVPRIAKTAQEILQPGRPDNQQRPLTDIRPDAPDRFKGNDTPDEVMNSGSSVFSGQSADPGNFDSQMGYDQSNPGLSNENGPAFRPSARKGK